KGFYMCVFPIMHEEWQAVMGNNPSDFKGTDHPVVRVSWEDCQRFCLRMGKSTGKHIRLPTEAEWEYACRAGTTSDYYTGNGEAALKEAGWFNSNSKGHTQPVGKLAPNLWGLYDMHGNVWEWCQDWHGGYPNENVEDYCGPPQGENRLIRGGCWYS